VKRVIVVLSLACSSVVAAAPEFPEAFFAEYCFDCHDDLTQKAEIRLDDAIDRDWSEEESLVFFERIKKVVEKGEMPPKKEKHRPSDEEYAEVTKWLHASLLEHSEVGGTVLRRLNRVEYEKTIQQVLGFSYQVPDGFPQDQHFHGFDNLGEGLVLSPTLMESYSVSAAEVADNLFPPPEKPVESSLFTASPDELVISYSSGYVIDGAMRIASNSPQFSRSCTWPTKFEAKASGTYDLKLDLSRLGSLGGDPFLLHVKAKKVSDSDGVTVDSLRLLTEFEVTSASPKTFETTIEIFRGETVVFYFANAVLNSDNKKRDAFRAYLMKSFESNPRLLAGWLSVELGQALRGGVGWERVKAEMEDPSVLPDVPAMDSPEVKKLVDTMVKNPVNYVECISYQLFEEGPSLGIHTVEIEGPLEMIEDEMAEARKRWQSRFLGSQTVTAETADPTVAMKGFLTRAFRRPAEEAEVGAYANLVDEHVAAGNTREEGFHLALRTALISPQFLYRETDPGLLDDWALASRLSYFLTSGPPDQKLIDLANEGKMSDPKVLASQTKRLLKDGRSRDFVDQFTSQWLGTRHLEDIMPDPRLLNFNDGDRADLIMETELFFQEVLKKNLPISTFIKPDFTFMNQSMAKKIYNQKGVESNSLVRVSLEEDSPHGGILGQASVMMATANGVDTQPVLRGVWVLENVLGDPPPPPPTNVPAITPDTRGAKTVRDLLNAHRDDESCFRCHQMIDPLGYVLENFDPVGRWRTHYPIFDKSGKERDGHIVDATGAMPDGHPFAHVNDLKNYVVEHIDKFGECLSDKLLMYATGRTLTYSDREALKPIVRRNIQEGGGFQDLMIELVQSEVFRTK